MSFLVYFESHLRTGRNIRGNLFDMTSHFWMAYYSCYNSKEISSYHRLYCTQCKAFTKQLYSGSYHWHGYSVKKLPKYGSEPVVWPRYGQLKGIFSCIQMGLKHEYILVYLLIMLRAMGASNRRQGCYVFEFSKEKAAF